MKNKNSNTNAQCPYIVYVDKINKNLPNLRFAMCSRNKNSQFNYRQQRLDFLKKKNKLRIMILIQCANQSKRKIGVANHKSHNDIVSDVLTYFSSQNYFLWSATYYQEITIKVL